MTPCGSATVSPNRKFRRLDALVFIFTSTSQSVVEPAVSKAASQPASMLKLHLTTPGVH